MRFPSQMLLALHIEDGETISVRSKMVINRKEFVLKWWFCTVEIHAPFYYLVTTSNCCNFFEIFHSSLRTENGLAEKDEFYTKSFTISF
ncbi:Spike glycoprotein [Dirofilaria immitis]